MDDLFERMARYRREREAVWRPPMEALLSSHVPGTTATVSALITAVLSGEPQPGTAKRALAKCGVSFGKSVDYVGVHWWRDNVPCVVISTEAVRRHLLQGTAWADKPVDELEEALDSAPGSIRGNYS